MSHLQHAAELRAQCKATGQCAEYDAYIQTQYGMYDQSSRQETGQIIISGSVVALLVALLLVAAFSAPLKRLIATIASWLLAISPVLVLAAAGVFGGLLFSFGACYKQSCDVSAETAMVWMPLLSLVISIPLSVLLFKRRQAVADRITTMHKLVWVAVAAVLLALTVLTTYVAVLDERDRNESYKQQLTTSEETI